jgi:hypothetical protein
MDVDEKKLKYLQNEVIRLLSCNNIIEFEKLLNNELTPEYLFVDHYHPAQIKYKHYKSIFTYLCKVGNINFVKTAIEKSKFNNEDNYLIGTATASGLINASEYGHMDVVKYLVQTNKKYEHIIGKDDGINLKVMTDRFGKTVLLFDILESSLTNALYNMTSQNMEIVEYLFLSDELDNHPKVSFEDLLSIFLKNNLDLFDKLFAKAMKENFDILELFNSNYFEHPNKDQVLTDLAKHLIHNLEIYNYLGVEEKIAQEPILDKVYLAKQLNNELLDQNNLSTTKKLKI